MKSKPSLWVWRRCRKTGRGRKESFYGLLKAARLCEGLDVWYRPEPAEVVSLFSSKPLGSQTTHRAEDEERKNRFFLPIGLWLDSEHPQTPQ